MAVNGEQSIRGLLNEKLNALSAVLRLGYEACQKGSLDAVAMHIVNNTRLVSQFDRSCLVDMRGGSPDIVAVMGVSELNPNSEYCVNVKALLQAFVKMDRPVVLREDILKGAKAPEPSMRAYEYFKEKSEDILLIPLREPDKTSAGGDSDFFVWVVEFFGNMGTDTEKLLLLLSQLYSVAVWHSLRPKASWISRSLAHRGRALSPGRVASAVFVAAIVLMLVLRVDQSALADFELEPPRKAVEYAPFNGMIKKSFFNNGQGVKKGQTVIEYDTDELNYQLSEATKDYEEICAELEMTRQNSFQNQEELGRIKVLEARRDRKKVEIDRAKWYLSKSVVKADRDGTISIEDPDSLSGKAVAAGARLFEIMPSGDLIAKVLLNEADSATLCPETKITLYLHSMPARPIKAEIVSVSPRPAMQSDRRFCYVIKSELDGSQEGLICGMRGVAKVSGRRVSLGYYLLRNALLWWRKI